MFYVLAATSAFIVALAATPLVARLARRLHIVDEPLALPRKQHGRSTPLLGGLAVFGAVALVVAVVVTTNTGLPGLFVTNRKLIALLAGGLVLMIGGVLDDRHRLRPAQQIIFPALAAAIAVAGGIVIPYVRNPLGGILTIAVVPGSVLTFLWLLGMMYTTKFLDGLDGLVSGMGVIATTLLLLLALRPELHQPDTALLAAIADGAFLGFLVWNFFPAKIFLGESGSTFVGFIVGALAVMAGSKVATTLLVLGIPILDVAWTIVSRLRGGRPLAVGDRSHLHFRLLDVGVSPRKAVLLLWALAALFGLSGLVLDTREKLLALGVLAIVMMALILCVKPRRSSPPL